MNRGKPQRPAQPNRTGGEGTSAPVEANLFLDLIQEPTSGESDGETRLDSERQKPRRRAGATEADAHHGGGAGRLTPVTLPFASEFSPGRVDLAELLDIVKAHEGDRSGMKEAVKARFFSAHAAGSGDPHENRERLSYNCLLGMRRYGLLSDGDARLTPLGVQLHALRERPDEMHARLARHILLELHGMEVVQCLMDMKAAGRPIGLKTTIPIALRERGIGYPKAATHVSSMRGWLAKARIFSGQWDVDERRLAEVAGIESEQFVALSLLTSEQRAFLRALINTGVSEPQAANRVADLAEATFGVRFVEGNLPKQVLFPLRDAGFIEAAKTTLGGGAKPYRVKPTGKLNAEVVEPLLSKLKARLDPKLYDLLRKPLSAVLSELESTDRNVRGLALEALAFHLMRLLDMTYKATRLRGNQTGGAEVDLVFETTRLVFSRWQIQCKNTDRVGLDDVAKEVGLTHFLKSNAIVIVGNGQIGTEARRYARKVMTDSNLCIVMVDKNDLIAIRDEPTAIITVFNREAEQAMRLKPLDGKMMDSSYA